MARHVHRLACKYSATSIESSALVPFMMLSASARPDASSKRPTCGVKPADAGTQDPGSRQRGQATHLQRSVSASCKCPEH